MKARILLAALRSSDASQSSSFTKSLVPAERSLRKLACAWGSFESEATRSEEHTSELQSLMRISYAVFCLKKKTNKYRQLMIDTRPQDRNKQHKTSLVTPLRC